MYKVVYWRYGARYVDEYETKAEANKQFNYISYHDIGFSECVLDANNVILRDGKDGIFGIKKEKRKGTIYEF